MIKKLFVLGIISILTFILSACSSGNDSTITTSTNDNLFKLSYTAKSVLEDGKQYIVVGANLENKKDGDVQLKTTSGLFMVSIMDSEGVNLASDMPLSLDTIEIKNTNKYSREYHYNIDSGETYTVGIKTHFTDLDSAKTYDLYTDLIEVK